MKRLLLRLMREPKPTTDTVPSASMISAHAARPLAMHAHVCHQVRIQHQPFSEKYTATQVPQSNSCTMILSVPSVAAVLKL